MLNLHQPITILRIQLIIQFEMHSMLPPKGSLYYQFKPLIEPNTNANIEHEIFTLQSFKQRNLGNSRTSEKKQNFALSYYNKADPLRNCIPMIIYCQSYSQIQYQENQNALHNLGQLDIRPTLLSYSQANTALPTCVPPFTTELSMKVNSQDIVRDLRRQKDNQDTTLNLGQLGIKSRPRLPSFLRLLIEFSQLCTSCFTAVVPSNPHDPGPPTVIAPYTIRLLMHCTFPTRTNYLSRRVTNSPWSSSSEVDPARLSCGPYPSPESPRPAPPYCGSQPTSEYPNRPLLFRDKVKRKWIHAVSNCIHKFVNDFLLITPRSPNV